MRLPVAGALRTVSPLMSAIPAFVLMSAVDEPDDKPNNADPKNEQTNL
ncbi:hypothetical protein KKD95_02520 [Patescibacteria group bacterium]|nr:hypothetical protein [Patescibacteria group bacterium]